MGHLWAKLKAALFIVTFKGQSMKTYKIEMILELNEEQSLEWVFQAIRDLLEDGETIQSVRYLEIETEIV
jgi:hypothetical protein